MDKGVDYHDRLLKAIAEGEVTDKASLQKKKIELCRELGLSTVPPNSETLARADKELLPVVKSVLRRKDVRTLSGVAVVAVMTSPAPCPHGRCTYCPGGVENNSPQSYTGKEPAARRASFNEFDPFRQVRARLEQLEAIGHSTDKVDLIVMGGTFTSRPWEYQLGFIKGCFDALNSCVGSGLEEAHRLNEGAKHRCIGMTVETRPDSFDAAMADRCMSLGTTRVEFGVQVLDDDILRSVNRGHGVKEVADATRVAKEKGLKVCYHIMPGLPGSSPEKDVDSFRLMFEDERFRPDMLKIYPTLVVKGTPLYEKWLSGEYEPYTTQKAVEVIARMKALAPPYVRIQRIQRDIPADLIEAGVSKGHLRELVRAQMRAEGTRCGCIRCREVGLNRIAVVSPDQASLHRLQYAASGGKEVFVSLDVEQREGLVGYARLRLPSKGEMAHLRELKVFGQMAQLGAKGKEWQHRGFGKELMAEAEVIASDEGYEALQVTSGVGVRRYYSAMGYERDGIYMAKRL
ncbi:MAG: tRNA uridine(34) 5-carboxymethylaminomethyl modification radical SAM/GNAT enzyme Elp3 [Methanomassiliicoccales archaeon]|jgi:elongator complex protein 3|nr:tRNA uridine(34) 5-carboxymethylaminomethyl modification radical SAM/GNAT enzyme Elp3 [Methanomassiliicoccales archaeon]MDD1756820.1 tRNA uridine(34) 5-carboxymethylaminomethyl modification radical SAM/GNAT enzyme Elp3 [Methanomassiliicoccales archaeon]